MTTARQQGIIEFPPGVDARALLRPMNHSGYWLMSAEGAARRRYVCRNNPLLFGLTYFPHHLRHQVTGEMSLAQPHLDMATEAEAWALAQGQRSILIGPRGLGKTRWRFCILPAWAMAFGHRRFVLAFSYTAEQAGGHLANLRMELDDNAFLRHDYAELCPRKSRGARQTATTVVNSGATIMVRGLGGTALGVTAGADRPDLLIGDDLEPSEADYSIAAKLKLQQKITDAILRMGAPHAVTSLSGTTTMPGSMIHDAVREALGQGDEDTAWIRTHGFTVRYYPPILDDGSSLWSQRWSVEQLLAEQARDPREFALNMLNNPAGLDSTGSAWWTQDLFRYWDAFPTVHRVVHLDVATTRRRKSDYTVLTMLGVHADGSQVCVEDVRWGKWSAPEIRAELARMVEGLRITEVLVEGNQGGDTWQDSLAPWPDEVGGRYRIIYARGNKETVRISRAHNEYARRAVWHSYRNAELERILRRWSPGSTEHDDVPDSIAGALAWWRARFATGRYVPADPASSQP